MKIEFLAKNYQLSEKLKDIIDKKIQRLDKFFDEDVKIKVVCKEANDVFTLELTIALGKTILRSEVQSDNMYNNIDLALPKLERQLIKHRERLSSKSKKFRIKELDMDFKHTVVEKKRAVVKSKAYQLTPMTVEDAIDELELVGHSFYVFANKSTETINILYKRNDGDYGLIEALV